MKKIRIISTPPGFANEEIRKQWVGIELPLVSVEEAVRAERTMDPNSPSAGGHIVRGWDAVRGLTTAGRHEAADFWRSPIPPSYLRFSRDCCVEI